nr:unnamed protein product [Callosobruchus chinensis]
MTLLSPFVYWAQNEDNLFIKVDLKDTQEPRIDIGRKKLHFLCKGVGAQGFQEYEFQLNFHCDVQENGNNFIKISDYKIDLTLRKAEKGWWPRLTSQPQKPAWLKIDFDRWQSEEDFIEEEVGDVRDDYPNLYEKLMKEEYGYRKEDFKKVYLTLYNLFMYVGFMYITSVLCIRYAREGTDFFPTVYDSVGHVMKYLQILQILEIFHPMVGYVRGGAFVPFLQIVGRFFILFLMLDKEERIQKMPVTFYLFLAWSAIEIIR